MHRKRSISSLPNVCTEWGGSNLEHNICCSASELGDQQDFGINDISCLPIFLGKEKSALATCGGHIGIFGVGEE